MKKTFITASELTRDSFALAKQIIESDFRPTFIIGLWRGGTPIAITIQETLKVCGIDTNHIAVRISAYSGLGQRAKSIIVHDLNYVVENINASDHLLIVDDVHDSGRSIQHLLAELQLHCIDNHPASIKFAALYYKPEKSEVNFVPDYYVHSTNEWIVFPHELEGLSTQELINEKPDIGAITELLLQNNNTSHSS